ncbi:MULTISPECIES: DeoR/GlpR family DNA-binding transcription regulator [unclassified Streptomyces]|uniref:DeoR/GlpR family DNA-binding transcription regulator n=1 Tax=unclassified Streptomyces TaxID=2593676 RepID=UPI001BEA17F0|nr:MULTISPECIES: DeoR/GlpR family DNA-binding transcription regulator [unclassified Streptomyces]MBT2406207.1 DeoR/GlpR transcriptional regulator [Streptomyces sp. ISL-21]MBT2459008.1 DeoR/GlpR transcriptional regulator [Streptomyces sp. ISL-86]MBT2609507.1 DeoR/GlpR transcriptional regulator [Streptomyces sp. ISL-87]
MADTGSLLAHQRRALILEEVRRRGGVRVNELTRSLNVSDMTVRRDLDMLAREGLLQKVHGGAVLAGEPSSHEPGFEAKSVWETVAKDAIARAAAGLVAPGSAIALSAGTTTHALAKELTEIPDLTVVTNSIRAAEVFEAARLTGGGTTVVLTGGIRTLSDALVGPIADQAIRSLHVDLLFLGCHGLGTTTGLTTPNLAEAETNRTFLRSARRTVVLADRTKWSVVGLTTFATLDQIDVLVTDALPQEETAAVTERVGEVVLATGNAGERQW